MDKYKKFMYIGIFILLISLVSSAGTYAWFTWISPSNTSVTLSIGNLADVTFTSGPDINISNLAPVYNYTDGVSTTFTVRNANSTDSLLYKVKLEITSIANELKDESFKYTLVKDNKVVKTGNLKDAVNGNTLILNTSSLDKGSTSSPKISTFKLYFWIDGNMENNPNMMNKSLVGKIDVGVETNVITNTESSISSTSKFLNSEVPRQNITTLKVVDNLDIPEGATVVDVSKNGDNTIKMWYNEADANGNYDITIGSNNTIYANPSSTAGLFSNLTNVTSIDLSNMDTSGMTSMMDMFRKDTSLTNITFGDNFNTANVTSMNGVFWDCNSLTSIDLSNFNTSNVTDINNMFAECSSLIALDLSNFDTSNVTSMGNLYNYSYGGMFRNCKSLTSLDLSNFDTSKVKQMSDMFRGCSNLTNLNLSNFNTSSATSMADMFGECSKLTSLDLSSFDTSNVTDMVMMFDGCSSLTSLDLSSFNTSNVTDMISMFFNCKNLTSLDLSNFDTSKVTGMQNMFYGCSSLTALDLSSFDTLSVINMQNMFYNCNSLMNLNLSSFNTLNVTNMISMFYNCNSLVNLNLSSFNTLNVTTMGGMFYNCRSLTSLDLSNFDTSKVTTMNAMFNGCSSLVTLDLSNFNTSKVTDMGGMFAWCSSLINVDLSSFDTSKVTAMNQMFREDAKLKTIYVSDKWNVGNVTNSSGMFSFCNSLVGAVPYEYGKFDASMANYTNGYLTYKKR